MEIIRYQARSEIVEALWQSLELCCFWSANRVLLYPDMSQRRQREAFQFEQSQPLRAEVLGAGLADDRARGCSHSPGIQDPVAS
jgi:hypothetical protein